jgi:hypothetical protein
MGMGVRAWQGMGQGMLVAPSASCLSSGSCSAQGWVVLCRVMVGMMVGSHGLLCLSCLALSIPCGSGCRLHLEG